MVCLGVSAHAAEPTPYDAIPKIAPEVQSMLAFGRWKTDQARGHYRVVLARFGVEDEASLLWVQWIAWPRDDTEPYEIAVSVGVEELNQGGYNYEIRRCGETVNKVTVCVKGGASTGGDKREWKLIATKPGKYSLLRTNRIVEKDARKSSARLSR